PDGVEAPHLFADEAYCLRRFGETLWAPAIPAGDVVIFDNFCVHRTHITDAMTRERQSADVRVFPIEGAPQFTRQWDSWALTFPMQVTAELAGRAIARQGAG